MKYYVWNKELTYEDLLNSICDCIYTRGEIYEETYAVGHCGIRYPRKKVIGYTLKLQPDQELKAFFKDFRHNENDGSWSRASVTAVNISERVYDEEGRLNIITSFSHYDYSEATFQQKPWIVLDSLGRVINSKDLRLDALNHNYNPNWKEKHRKKYNYPLPTSYRNGYWQKYLGNHDGAMASYRKDIHHNNDCHDVLVEFGVTYKVRAKRTSELYRATDWDGGKSGWIERGWKQSRKKKQYM